MSVVQSLILTATADLGDTVWTAKIRTSDAPQVLPFKAAVQIFAYNAETGTYPAVQEFVQYSPRQYNFFPGQETTVVIPRTNTPKGHYGAGKLVLFFADGTTEDVPFSDFSLTVETSQSRVVTPYLWLNGIKTVDNGDGTYNVGLTGEFRYPKRVPGAIHDDAFNIKFQDTLGNFNIRYFYASVNGDTSQMPYVHTAEGADPYNYIKIEEIPDDLGNRIPQHTGIWLYNVKPGFASVSVGLFNGGWNQTLQWADRFDAYGFGDWHFKATRKPVLPALNLGNGANYGNAAASQPTVKADDDTVGFFTVLRRLYGFEVLRLQIKPEMYMPHQWYRDYVADIVNQMWEANVVPVIGASGVPAGGASALLEFNKQLATDYKGQPVLFHLCNEPFDYQSWTSWKPIAEANALAVRAIDPSMKLICPTEGYQRSAVAAGQSPLAAGLVDWYDVHYPEITDIAQIPANIPVLVGEYANESLSYAFALQASPIVAAWAYAFCQSNYDSLGMVIKNDGAIVVVNARAEAIQANNKVWQTGKKLVLPPAPPPTISVDQKLADLADRLAALEKALQNPAPTPTPAPIPPPDRLPLLFKAGFEPAGVTRTGGTPYPASNPEIVYYDGNPITWTISLTPGGNVAVTLSLIDDYQSEIGQRLADVTINGTPVLTNFDVVLNAGGQSKMTHATFAGVVPADGMLKIALTGKGGANPAYIHSIKIEQVIKAV